MTFDQVGTLSIDGEAQKSRMLSDQSASLQRMGYVKVKTTATAPLLKAAAPWGTETLSELFNGLVVSWMRETRYTNSMSEILENRHLTSIISLGPVIVPLILADLDADPKHWFYALHKLTGADPVSEDHAGNLQKMRGDWLAWGRTNGFVI